MRISKRQKREERKKSRNKFGALNLVSLMDIFTILVFFLLVNTSDSYQLPNLRDIIIPTAKMAEIPSESVVVTVTKKALFIDSEQLIDINELSNNEGIVIKSLENKLVDLIKLNPDINNQQVTIVADESVPYSLIKRLLETLQSQNFYQIAFAANQKEY
ncbi:MAG: ExbD/TolR family protein [Cellvibrio sp.]